MNRLKIPSLAGLTVLALVVVFTAGCGGSGKKASSTTTSATTNTTSTTISTPATHSKIAAEVPPQFKSKTLTFATDATYAPNEVIGSHRQTTERTEPAP